MIIHDQKAEAFAKKRTSIRLSGGFGVFPKSRPGVDRADLTVAFGKARAYSENSASPHSPGDSHPGHVLVALEGSQAEGQAETSRMHACILSAWSLMPEKKTGVTADWCNTLRNGCCSCFLPNSLSS